VSRRYNNDDIAGLFVIDFNPLMGKVNYSVTSNNMKLVHWPLIGGLLHLVQMGGTAALPGPSLLYQM